MNTPWPILGTFSNAWGEAEAHSWDAPHPHSQSRQIGIPMPRELRAYGTKFVA